MVPTCPFPGRLAPSSTATEVPTCASCDSKTFAPSSVAVWDQTRTPAPKNAFPFPPRIYSRALHLFMYSVTLCVQQHYPGTVYEYRFGNGLDLLKLCERYELEQFS